MISDNRFQPFSLDLPSPEELQNRNELWEQLSLGCQCALVGSTMSITGFGIKTLWINYDAEAVICFADQFPWLEELGNVARSLGIEQMFICGKDVRWRCFATPKTWIQESF